MYTRYLIESNIPPSVNTYHLKNRCYSMYKDMVDMQENVKQMDSLLKSDALKREKKHPMPTPTPTPLRTNMQTIYSSNPHSPLFNVNVIQSPPIIIDIILPEARKSAVIEYAVGKGMNAAKLINKHIPPKVYYR